MAITGTEVSLAVRKWTDAIEMELQQKGSLLTPLVTVEPGVMGERTYFKRAAKITGATEHTVRFEEINFDRANFETRSVSPKTIDKGVHMDQLDVLRMSRAPDAETVQNIVEELGRAEDKIVLAAFGGSASRQIDGSESAAIFDSNNTIGVSDGAAYATSTVTGDTALHEGKIELAKLKLQQAHVDLGRNRPIVIASAKQLAALRVRMNITGVSRRDFMGTTPLRVAGADDALEGYLGCTYVHFETLADEDQLSGGDEYVYVLVPAAVKVGIWKPLEVTIDKDMSQRGHPDRIYAQKTLGAVRMDEAKIVRILCNV